MWLDYDISEMLDHRDVGFEGCQISNVPLYCPHNHSLLVLGRVSSYLRDI